MVTWKRDLDSAPAPVSTGDFAAARDIKPGSGDPLIAFSREAWEMMLSHVTASSNEVGGVLAGTVFADPDDGRLLIDVASALPARGALETATYFQLTPAAWDHISRVREAGDDDTPLIGWYHSHPGLGVFYSGTDRASQRAFFRRPWNFGVVIDPVRNDWAIFLGPESRRLEARQVTWYNPNFNLAGQPLPGAGPDVTTPEPALAGVAPGPMSPVPVAPEASPETATSAPVGGGLRRPGPGLVWSRVALAAMAGAFAGVALRGSWRRLRRRFHVRG